MTTSSLWVATKVVSTWPTTWPVATNECGCSTGVARGRTRVPIPVSALSPFTLERMREDQFVQQVKLFPNTPIESITRVDSMYEVAARQGYRFQTRVPPLLASGFEGSHRLVADLFEPRDDGSLLLSEHDESTIVPGVFLCGPTVRHNNHDFCFIFK